jgi:hypothetical protein
MQTCVSFWPESFPTPNTLAAWGAARPWGLALRMLLTHRLGLIDLELGMAIEAEDLFELEHLTRPVILEQDHLDLAARLHPGQCCSKFANRHHGVLIDAKNLLW